MIDITKRNGSIATLIMSFLLISLPDVKSQKIELSPFFGYGTAAKFPRDESYMRIGGGIDYGVSLNYKVASTWRLEISYRYLKSDISLAGNSNRTKYCDLKSTFLFLGGLKEISPGNRVNPYGLLAFGWVNYHPISNGYYNANLLHFSLGGGVKVAVTDNFGFRFQASLIMPVWFAGEYFAAKYYGPIIATNHTMVVAQGEFTVAAILVLDKRHE